MVPIEDAYFLRDLSPRELNKVSVLARAASFADGESIIRVGAKVRAIYVVGKGRANVVVPVGGVGTRDEGDALGAMTEGEVFGELSFVDRRPASASVVASGDTTVHQIDFADLDALMEADSVLALKLLRAILKTVVARLRSTDAELAMAAYVQRAL